MEAIQFGCGDALFFDYHESIWAKRNNKTTLCSMCYSKLINIHQWGAWDQLTTNNLSPLGGRIVVRDADYKIIEIIQRPIHKGRMFDWIYYKKEKHRLYYGSRYKTIHLKWE